MKPYENPRLIDLNSVSGVAHGPNGQCIPGSGASECGQGTGGGEMPDAALHTLSYVN